MKCSVSKNLQSCDKSGYYLILLMDPLELTVVHMNYSDTSCENEICGFYHICNNSITSGFIVIIIMMVIINSNTISSCAGVGAGGKE